jgi:hypothetical protein
LLKKKRKRGYGFRRDINATATAIMIITTTTMIMTKLIIDKPKIKSSAGVGVTSGFRVGMVSVGMDVGSSVVVEGLGGAAPLSVGGEAGVSDPAGLWVVSGL